MLWLSEVLIKEHQLDSFEQLKQVLRTRAATGERFFSMDVKPTFADTPDNWEDQLESVFTSGQ